MRAIVIAAPGGPDVLQIADVATPEPGPGEVRVRVAAFGINRADILQRLGFYPAPPGAPADILGLEYAGEIDAVGDDIGGSVRPGDRVMGIVAGGAYAEFLVTPADHVVAIPENLSLVDAAAVPEVFITAHDALERLEVTRGEWVIVHAAGSGVGTAAIQLIAARGARSIGTSRSPAKLDRAKALGLDAGVAGVKQLADHVKRITDGDGAHAAVDLIGGAAFAATLRALRTRGRLVLVGLTAGRTAEVDLGVVLSKRLRIEGTVLRARSHDEKTAVTESFAERVVPLIRKGEVKPVIDRVFSFTEVTEAHAHVEANANFGKVLVTLDRPLNS